MPHAPVLRAVSQAPRLFVADGFLSEPELEHLLSKAASEEALRALGLQPRHDGTGLSCELPVAGDAVLQAVCQRIESVTGIRNRVGQTLRFRRYSPGEAHPLHTDSYQLDGWTLVATAMLCLTAPEAGGETSFPSAQAGPLSVSPQRGRLVLWFNHRPDGSVDPSAHHEGLAVLSGAKTTLTSFIYAPLGSASVTPRTGPFRARFYCVNDGVPAETTTLLRDACLARHVEYIEVDAPSFDYRPERELSPGELLYRPAISMAAMRVEQFLSSEGVATFHHEPDGVFFDCLTSPLYLQRAGVPIPRTVYCATTRRDVLRGYVEHLGGFPLVFKLLGGSGGIGVMRVDSYPALFSLVDHALSRGSNPLLCAYVPDAVHWRVIVVGARAVAAYRNTQEPDDFRTYASTDARDYLSEVPPALAEVAVRAVHTLRSEFGGVDILEHASGRLFVLEANFPCYFPQAQQAAGIDISGMMVDHLLAKAERLLAAASTGVSPPRG